MNKTPFAFVLYGNPVTKKNSPVMVKGRSVLLPSEAYRKYESSCRKALQVLKVQEKLRHFSMGVSMCCLYYLEIDILPMPKGRGFLDTNDTCLLK